MLVGITGGIGSGKSTIAHELVRRGYAVYDCDRMAKHIIVYNPAVRSQVELLFGSDVFDGDRYLTDRVARQVFADPTLLERLNAIVHPAVVFDLRHWYSERKDELCFVESAILFESGVYTLCDKTVRVDAPEQVRIARTVARDHSDINKVRARIEAQKKDAGFNTDIVINNDGTESIEALADSLIS